MVEIDQIRSSGFVVGKYYRKRLNRREHHVDYFFFHERSRNVQLQGHALLNDCKDVIARLS